MEAYVVGGDEIHVHLRFLGVDPQSTVEEWLPTNVYETELGDLRGSPHEMRGRPVCGQTDRPHGGRDAGGQRLNLLLPATT